MACSRAKGLVFNLLRFSVHDGPGIRTTVFLKGCPLSCWWCHNPESQSAEPELMYAAEQCIRCGDCVKVCPVHALRWQDRPIRNVDTCLQCGKCAEMCMADARRLVGEWITVEDLINRLRRDVTFFDESGGGVTFSGGEPLLQSDFLSEALGACKLEGMHTTVDTCGFAPQSVFERISGKVDLFLFDLKFVDTDRHRQFTGVSNELILENLSMLVRNKEQVVVRIPLIPGVNDDGDNIRGTMQLLSSIGVKRVDLLSYHATGMNKYVRLERSYCLQEIVPPSVEKIQRIADRFEQEGFTVRIGG